MANCPTCGHETAETYFGIRVHKDLGTIEYNDRRAYLSQRQFEIIYFLLRKHGNAVTREALHYQLYQLVQEDVSLKIIDVFLCQIRKKLKPLGIKLKTRWGFGVFIPDPKQA